MANNIKRDTILNNRLQHDFVDILKYAFTEIVDKNKQFYFENKIAISMSSVHIKNYRLFYGLIGTCSLLIYRKSNIIEVSCVEDTH